MKYAEYWIGLCILIFAIGIAGSMLVLNMSRSTIVEIVQDGNILYSFDLSQTKNQIIEIEYKGKINTIEIKEHQIRMIKAECPDESCVHMGYLKSSILPIVCLPNHLIIRFSNIGHDLDATAR